MTVKEHMECQIRKESKILVIPGDNILPIQNTFFMM